MRRIWLTSNGASYRRRTSRTIRESSGGTILARFDTSSPDTIDQTVAVTGIGPGEQLRGIDFRPATGELYALAITPTAGDDKGSIYTVDPQTGVATLLGPGPFSTALAAGSQYAFDFNPAVDRIRIANGQDQSLRVNPNNGALVQFDTPLNNASDDEEVTGGAYDRNVNDVQPAGTPASLTTLFGIDFINDALVRIGGVDGGAPERSANAGVVTTIGPLGLTTGSAGNGFDIAQDGTACAVFNNGNTGVTSLYSINLVTGAATAIDLLGNGAEIVRGFAIAPDDVPPAASVDAYQVPAGGSLTVSAADGVLANDTDAEGNALTAERITNPANGALIFNADGPFQYTPNLGFIGTDSFSYVANDGTSDSQAKTVTLNVVPLLTINDKAVSEGNSGTKQLTFTVTLSAPAPAGGVTVNYRDDRQYRPVQRLERAPQRVAHLCCRRDVEVDQRRDQGRHEEGGRRDVLRPPLQRRRRVDRRRPGRRHDRQRRQPRQAAPFRWR